MRWILVGLTSAFVLAGSVATLATIEACRAPTEIRLHVTTRFDCSLIGTTGVTVAAGEGITDGAVTTTSRACKERDVGTLVVVPSGAGNHVTLEVITMLGGTLDGNGRCAEGTPGCIHARRSLAFIPHAPIDVPVVLDDQCAGIPCGVNETCDRGRCIDATCPDGQTSCTLGVDGGSAEGGGPEGGSYAATCGELTYLRAGAPYPMSLGCGGDFAVSSASGPKTAPSKETIVPVGGDGIDAVIDETNVGYVVTMAGAVVAIDLANPNPVKWTGAIGTTSLASTLLAADGTIHVGGADAVTPFARDGGKGSPAPAAGLRSDLGLGPGGLLAYVTNANVIETKRLGAGMAPGPSYALSAPSNYPHPFSANGKLWCGAGDGTLRVIEPTTMTEIDRVKLGQAASYEVSAANGPDGRVRALWVEDGSGKAIVGAIDATTRKIVWQVALDKPNTAATLLGITLDGITWVADSATSVTTYDPNGAKIATMYNDASYPTFDVDGYFYAGGATGLTAYDAKGVVRWTTKFQHGFRAITVGKGGILLATSTDGNAYVYAP